MFVFKINIFNIRSHLEYISDIISEDNQFIIEIALRD